MVEKKECGHPIDWNLRLVENGRKYSYCLGCIVEGLQLNNLEAYDCPFIKLKNPKEKPIKTTIKKNANIRTDL